MSRWYFSFGYAFKKIRLSIEFGDDDRSDLVGYGYDIAPILRSLKVNILFFEFVIGNILKLKSNDSR